MGGEDALLVGPGNEGDGVSGGGAGEGLLRAFYSCGVGGGNGEGRGDCVCVWEGGGVGRERGRERGREGRMCVSTLSVYKTV